MSHVSGHTKVVRYRLALERGKWHRAEPPLSVMVLAAPKPNVRGHALVSSDDRRVDFDVVRIDWETLAVWGVAEVLSRPAPVSPITTAEEDP